MEIKNTYLSISLNGGKLSVHNKKLSQTLLLDWPAVSVSIKKKRITPARPLNQPVVSKNRISQSFEENGLRFTVTVTLSRNSWFTKNVSISSGEKLPTPDFAEVDWQILPPDGMRSCGYIPSTLSESDMAATMPGCGYPLIGKHFFTGLEHPAGFNLLSSNGEEFWLKHYPVWDGDKLEEVSAVFGWGENARETFDAYLDSIRLPMLKKPLFIFCTFWSDLRNPENMFEYLTSYQLYEMYFKAFFALGLKPDLFTLDAGWQDRMSIFQAKKEVGGDAGLIKLRKLAEKNKSGLSLWVSHNGPMGIATEYMKKQGFETGAGNSSTYSGDGFGIMMDGNLSKAVEKRFCELLSKIKVKHLKIDWDNDCATNQKFEEKYPTRNHVRQATLNIFFRIAAQLRKINPAIVTRNGWWPSPWWMPHASHIHLSDSGDSEFSSLPSKTQRAASTTHRDLMYYNIFQRDKTPLPLECLDNFKFPNALQNPYPEDPASWVGTAWMHCMRGSTQIAYTLTPEALEDWQAESLRRIMDFCRTYAKHIFVPHGRMILGHPGKGEIYGFLQPGKKESWCILRNPLPIPQTVKFNPNDFGAHKVKSTWQFYPCYETPEPEKGIAFLAHEIRILIFSAEKQKTPFGIPYMVTKKGGDFLSYFPASETVTKTVRPMVHAVQRINSIKCMEAKKKKLPNGVQYMWRLEIPYKMKESELQFCIKAEEKSDIKVRAVMSRSTDGTSEYLLPVTAIQAGIPGYGEKRNMDFPVVRGERYYAVRIPYGGQFSIWLTLEGLPETGAEISAWIAGYEALSRNAAASKKCPVRFSRCLPFQHPLGFGRTLKLPVAEGGK